MSLHLKQNKKNAVDMLQCSNASLFIIMHKSCKSYIIMLNQETEKEIEELAHLYTSCDSIATSRKSTLVSLEQALQKKISTSEEISDLYGCINQIIYSFKTNQEKKYTQITQWKQKSYLQFKAKLFYKFYSCEKTLKNEAKKNLHMFEINNLHLLFTEILEIRNQLKPLIYKLFGESTRNTKIKGYLLLEKIESLLKEVTNAAFPYDLYPHTGTAIQLFSQTIAQTPQRLELMQKELEERAKFKFDELQPLKNSLLQIDDEIESIQIQNKKEELQLSKISGDDFTLGQIGLGLKQLEMGPLELKKFKHNFYRFTNVYANKAIQHKIEYFLNIVKEEPVNHLKAEKIEIVSQQIRNEKLYLKNYFIYWKNLIEVLTSLSIANRQEYFGCVRAMMETLQKWIHICKFDSDNLLLIENYIILLKAYKEFDATYSSKRIDQLYQIFQKYIDNLINELINQNSVVSNRIISLDEEFTYSLLTTNSIISTLISYEEKFIDLVQYFAPILQILIQITLFSQKKRDKQAFVQSIITTIHYTSQNDSSALKTLTKSQLKLNNIAFDIQFILSFNHSSIHRIKPYLKEIKTTLTLLGILKKQLTATNLNREEQHQYEKLKQVASYFYTQRHSSPIFELKSKILLFITLFKMGFHNPIIKQHEKQVNLRIRIINLYNKLYSNSSAMNNNYLMSLMLSQAVQNGDNEDQDYIYDPQSYDLIDVKIISSIYEDQAKDEFKGLESSEQLETKINKFIADNFVSTQNNGKAYLINLMNILEHELFALERGSNEQRGNKLAKDFISHLKNCLGVEKDNQNPDLELLLEVEKLFFEKNYEKAWKQFAKHKNNNEEFNIFLELFDTMVNNSSILKFLRVYNLFEKMDHLFYNEQEKDKNIIELLEAVNSNNFYQIPKDAIECLYDMKENENKFKRYESFYNNKLKGVVEPDEKYKQIASELNAFNIKIFQHVMEGTNKKFIKIEIGQQFKNYHKQLSEQFIKYYLFNQTGIYKINEVKLLSKSLIIILESNSYILKNEQNIFQSYPNSYVENVYEKFCRKSLQTIIQSLHIFYNSPTSSFLLKEQIDFELDPLTFCINPYYGLIESVLLFNEQNKLDQFSKNKRNREVIQNLLTPFALQFNSSFRENYYYFLASVTEHSKKGVSNYNKLLEVPLFMTLQQKEMFLVYFDNKMSEMCDNFHEEERRLLRERKYIDAEKKRLVKMKDSIYKNYSYHFIIGGTLESDMTLLKICSETESNKLDWISEHKDLLISYSLPTKNNSEELKEFVYSFNSFLKHLRGSVAHKNQSSYSIILNICSQFPKLIDYLYSNKFILQARFDEVMSKKNSWLRDYFVLTEGQLKKLKQIIDGTLQIKGQANADVKQSINILQRHKKKYEKDLKSSPKLKSYQCQKCNDFIRLIKTTPQFVDFVRKLHLEMAKKSHILSADHSFRECYLSDHFKNQRILTIFGNWSKKIDARHYFVMNWWFYLQSQFPTLIKSLDKIRYLLDS